MSNIPTTLVNPYKPGSTVTGAQFYGRRALLAQLMHDDYRGAYIIGTRQIGKTSLLREIERRLPAFYLDASYMGPDPARWVKGLQRSVAQKWRVYPWLPDTAMMNGLDFFNILEQVGDAAEAEGQRVWLLLDEAEDLLDLREKQPRFLKQLRAVTEMLPCLSLVLAGYRQLLELRHSLPPCYLSPLLGGLVSFILGPLSPAETIAIIRQTQMSPGVEVDEVTLHGILAEAGGHPSIVQRWGNYLWQEGRLQPLDNNLRHRIDADAENIFPADFESLSATEQHILLGLRSGQAATLTEIETLCQVTNHHLERAVCNLVELGFLTEDPHLNTYTLRSRILSRWLSAFKASARTTTAISDPALLELHAPDDKQSKKSTKETKMPDPYTITWAIMVVNKATDLLFNQVGEILKARRDKQAQAGKLPSVAPTTPSASEPALTDQPSVQTALAQQLTAMEQQAKLAAARMQVQEVESLTKQVEHLHQNKMRYEEEAVNLPGLDDRIAIRQRIETIEQQMDQKADKMRQLLEQLSQRQIHLPC